MALQNFISGVKKMWIGTEEQYIDTIMPMHMGKGSAFNIEDADRIATVYTCIKVLSETLSRMPLNVYKDVGNGKLVNKDDYRYSLLHYNPNGWTSQQSFFTALEYWRNIKGNSFARIYRGPNGKVKSLELIAPSRVIGYAVTNGELYYTIGRAGGGDEVINSSEMLHFKGITKDGIWGLNPIEALRYNLSSSYQGILAIDSFYQNNAMSPKAIKSTVSGVNQKAMLEALNEFNSKYAGATKAGMLAALPPNTDIVDLSMSFADAEFISTMKFNSQMVAALFGVPPHMVGILEATKFNNVEQMMLDFKVSTLSAIGRLYRQELESKLLSTEERLSGTSIEFNFNALLETDSTTRINNQKTLTQMGVMTINDVCKIEGYKTYPEGDFHIMPGNYLTVEKVIGPQLVKDEVVGAVAPTEDIQKAALNGAQISSLIMLITSISQGIMTKETAKGIIVNAFPTFSTDEVNKIVDSVIVNPITEPTQNNLTV